MCGILGSFSGKGQFDTMPFWAQDLDTMMHRGPDGQGWFVDRHAVMAFRRLAIIDLVGGMQPLFSEDEQVVLTVNGEIYNYRSLRNDLAGKHRFRTNVDSEVLIHLYEEYGLEFLDHVNGMFAFAIYDRRKRRVVLGRDRAGQKPLYYQTQADGLRWASEMGALIREQRPPVCRQALSDYLRFGYVPAPLTMLDGIMKLPAGSMLIAEEERPPELRRYWRLQYARDDRISVAPSESEEWSKELLTQVDRAVRLRLESEVPMGFLLSGGIDSASVFATGAIALGSASPSAFTVSFKGEAIDESAVAAEVARRYGATHVVLNLKESKARSLSKILAKVEEPVSTDALLPTDEVFAGISSQHITTVLSGEGSDELFAGYRKFRHASPWNQESPRSYRSPLERYLANEEFVFPDPVERKALLGGDEYDGSRFDALEQEASELDPLSQMLLIENRLRLPDRINLRLDRLSMAYSIEARSPFMDYHLMEFCTTIPNCLKTTPDIDKWILRNAMKQRLPPSVIDARKAPFHAPGRWSTESDSVEKVLGRTSVNEAGLVCADEVSRIRKKAGQPDEVAAKEKLFSLYVLHAWFWSFCRGRAASPHNGKEQLRHE